MASFYEELNKKSTLSDEEENKISRETADKWILGLLLSILGFMPLIVLADIEEVVSPLISGIELLSSGMKGDLFTSYKQFYLVVITIFVSIIFLSKIYFMNGVLRKTKLNYILGMFVIVLVASTIFSPNISIALNGQYNRSDGAVSWLCYIILMFIAMNINYPKNIITYIMYTMMPFIYINLFITAMNFYGKDILQNKVVQKLISITLPEGADLAGNSQLVGTLNQWNYMSGMFAIMTVMYIVWAIITPKAHERIIGVINACVSVAVMLMSISTSGFLTLIVSLSIVIIYILFKMEKKMISLAILAVFLIFSSLILHILSERNENVWKESVGFFVEANPYAKELVSVFKVDNVAYASDDILEFPVLPERGYSAGTGRIYIWGKTVDLVKERVVLGYGSDSLMYNFPHFNLDSRAGMMDENIITDKPHSVYVGVLYGFGVFGLIALIVVIFNLVKMLGECIFSNKGTTSIFILAITATTYFVQALFNDSLPSMSSMVFIFMGILFTLSCKQKEI